MQTPRDFLEYLNTEYYRLHKLHEDYYWDAYMGNKPVGKLKDKALARLDAFRGDANLKNQAGNLQQKATTTEKERLAVWVRFFNLHQIPAEAQTLRAEISVLETKIHDWRANRTEGYIDPYTQQFTPASTVQMRMMIQTNDDEKIRRACFVARESLATDTLPDYVELVKRRNVFARLIGYSDFYDYKVQHIDGMTKDELFSVFSTIRTALSPVFDEIRQAEKFSKGLRQPWNFSYRLNGDFIKAEEPYYKFEDALERWLSTFARLGVSFRDGSMTLDLLDRKGKYNNGFCHWPDLVHYKSGKRVAGRANFTCVVVPNQVGSGKDGFDTLFHEGGHAAHFLSIKERDVCLNHEYAPMTAAWAETQSMFMDTLMDSYEWKRLYAKNSTGEAYPEELYKDKLEANQLLRHTSMMSIIFIAEFERAVYELKTPTAEAIKKIATREYRRHYDQSSDSLRALNTPHIYAFESACAYHGYGLAEIVVSMWREYFYKKYGYIVDNKMIGKEMATVWAFGSRYDFKTAIKLAMNKKLSAGAYIRAIMKSPSVQLKVDKERLKATPLQRPTNLDSLKATISLVHGKKVISNSSHGFTSMIATYKSWLKR